MYVLHLLCDAYFRQLKITATNTKEEKKKQKHVEKTAEEL